MVDINLIIVDDSIIDKILNSDSSIKRLLDFVFWRKIKLLCTDTMKQKIYSELKENNEAFQILSNVVDFEKYDFKEENLTAHESVVQYVNTSSYYYSVIFITEKSYDICSSGSNDKIRDCVTIFPLNSFNKWAESNKEFMDWLGHLI